MMDSKAFLFVVIALFGVFAEAQLPITNFSRVGPGIYRGGRVEEETQLQLLKRLKVKTILNLQGGDLNSIYGPLVPLFEKGELLEFRKEEKAWADRNGFLWANLPLNSLSAVSRSQATMIRQAVAMIQDPRLQPVFLHCEHGVDRTGLVIALYRIKIQKWPMARAYDEMEANGRNWLHQLFTSPLDDFLYKEARKKLSSTEQQLHGVLNENFIP